MTRSLLYADGVQTGSSLETSLSAKADLASPALTGVPTAPTASPGTNTTQLATTAFVQGQGFITGTGSMTVSNASSTTPVTSATTTFVTAISTTITVTATSAPVQAIATGHFTTTTAAATVMKYRVSVNGVAGQEQLLTLTALTTNYTAAVQYISASLTPGTYTVLFEFARNSGTGTVNFIEGTLDVVALQGAGSAGITSISGLGLSAGPGSGAQSLTGTLSLAGGGTNASNAAVNGGIAYSTASAINFSAAGASGQLLRSAGAATPTWTTATFPATTTINQILYSSAANVITGLATTNTGALVASSTGVPSLASGSTANRVLRTNGTTVSFAQVAAATDVSGILPGANGGTGVTMFASTRIPFSNGTTYAADALFLYNTATNQFTVGNGAGTGKISSVVLATDPTPNLIAGNFFNRGTNNTIVSQNEGSTAANTLIQNSGSTFGASLQMNYSRGTVVARTQSLSGDILASLLTNGHTGAGFAPGNSGGLSIIATENTTSTAQGADLVLSTTPNTTNVAVERLRLTQDGEAAFTGNIQASVLGKGLQIKTGTNSKIGTAVLVGGTVTVANTSVTANSLIFLTSQIDGGIPGFLRISATNVGTDFTITSSNVADTSTVAWTIIESIP